MSVPCTELYVPICIFLSIWSGFQMGSHIYDSESDGFSFCHDCNYKYKFIRGDVTVLECSSDFVDVGESGVSNICYRFVISSRNKYDKLKK